MIKRIYVQYRELIVYVFFGGCTTFVNLCTYYLLRAVTDWNYNVENIISISLSILFAYFVNSRFVFQSQAQGFRQRFSELLKFISARLTTMLIEVGGVWLMVDILQMSDRLSKLMVQFVVLLLNYFFSKLLVFRKGKDGELQ